MTKPKGSAAPSKTGFSATRRPPVPRLAMNSAPRQGAAAAEATPAPCAEGPFGALICDEDLVIIEANSTGRAQLGFADAQEFVRCNLLDFVLPDDQVRIKAAVRDLLDGRLKSYSGELRLARRDGLAHQDNSTVWVLLGLSLTHLADAAAPCLLIEMADITALKDAQAALAKSEELFRKTIEHSPIGLTIVGPDGRYKIVNQAFCRLLGYAHEDLIGKTVKEVTKAGDPTGTTTFQRQLKSITDGSRLLTKTYIDSRGGEILVDLNAKMVRDENGEFLFGVGQIQDATARLKQLEDLHDAKELAQVTIASIAEGLIRTDIEGRITLCNEAAANMLGFPSSEIHGKYFSQLVSFVDHRNGRCLPDPVTAVLLQDRPVRLGPYAGLKRSDGRVRPIIDSTAPLRCLDGRMIGTVVVIQDATETFVLTERLAAQAYRDDLTRLPNRRAFEDHIAERLRAKRHRKLCDFLLFIDLDHFKVVNDTCGHAIGDELLREAALMLRAQIRESDFAARLGGDEFDVVLHATSERVASSVAESILTALEGYRFVRDGRSFEIGASIGMTTIESCHGDASAIMIEADTACYAAKNLGRGRFHVFRRDDETIANARRSMGWLHRIQQGFEKNNFKLFVQKIVDGFGETCGYEALVRLAEEDGTLCSPDVFLPVAKRFGLMGRIDRLIFQKVFDLLSEGTLLGESIAGKYVSVNMSPASLTDPMFRAWLNEMLLRHPKAVSSLWIEITETDEMHWAPAEVEFLARLRDRGVRLYLDDFGTGYNSFEALKRIDVDGIKIDRSVVRDMASDPIDQALVVAAISIVSALAIDLVAEGVEDQVTLDFLSHHGIKRFQGFLFHRPQEVLVDLTPARLRHLASAGTKTRHTA
jgi:diguanylate cyclase (GGDEF)-like protein/PAS domain S-box-containing protein